MVNLKYNLIQLQDEFLNKVRAHNNHLDPQERVELKTKTFTGTGTQTIFKFEKNNFSFVKSVTVDGTPLYYGTGYVVNFRDDLSDPSTDRYGSIEFVTAPTNNANIETVWGKRTGQSEFVFDSFPRVDLEEKEYPRVGLQFTVNSNPRGTGGGDEYAIQHSVLIEIMVIDTSIMRTKYITTEIENFIKSNIRNFYWFKSIFPSTLQPLDNFRDDGLRSFWKISNYEIPDVRETVDFGAKI